MDLRELLFWVFSALILVLGLGVIGSRNPIHSALCLVALFFFLAGLFVLLEAYFLAVVQVLIYAGAVMVLFLFLIMLLDVRDEARRRFRWLGLIGVAIVVGMFLHSFGQVWRELEVDVMSVEAARTGTTEEVGLALYRDYLLPFETASLILLVAMIGVIGLSRRDAKESPGPAQEPEKPR